VVVVCLSKDIPTDHLAATASARLDATPWISAGPARVFRIGARLRRARLVQPARHTTVGGPLRLLDLDTMRREARDAYWYRWHVWRQVVDGTRDAQPWWQFLDRHREQPAKYSMAKARQQYLAQPRVAAMSIYNALPNKVMRLPTGHLEALQAGVHAYSHLGLLCAVPRDGLVVRDGRYLATASTRLADQLSYLDAAQQEISQLDPGEQLVALATA